MRVLISALGLGDIVELFADGYGTGTVQQVTEDEVHIFRPYIHCGDFSHTGGVTTYIGHELVKLYRKSSLDIKLLRKGGPLR